MSISGLASDLTDEELMSQYQKGSEKAFAQLYSRHSGKIFGYLRSRVKSEQRAADLFQEVFIKIHKSKNLYKSSLPVLPWLFSITHSVMIDGFRKEGRQKEVYNYNFDQLASLLPVDSDVIESEKIGIEPLLNHLPGTQKIALELRYVEEKTFEDIAKILKVSPLNARQMVSRGVRHLKQVISKGDKS